MKKYFLINLVCALFIFHNINTLASSGELNSKQKNCSNTFNVCFSPNEACTQELVNYLRHAKKSIYVSANAEFSFPIAQALLQAASRHVMVKIILDKSQTKNNPYIKQFLKAGIPIWIDFKLASANNSVMIIDKIFTVTGSYNYSMAAQAKNTDNMLIINDEGLAQKYKINWNNRQKASMAYAEYIIQ